MNHLLQANHPLWGQAFRPLFLLAAGFSSLAMLLWGASLQGLPLMSATQSVFWHSHEMLFGFAMAVVAGFLLTAVQNWTGQRATHGAALLWLTLLWLAARLMMLAGDVFPWWLTAAVDLAFVPLVAWLFGRMLWRVKQRRNYVFVALLLLVTASNALMHWGAADNNPALLQWGSYNVSWLLLLMITLIGGRVMPMFTANGSMTPKVEPLPWLEKLVLFSSVLLLLLFVSRLYQQLNDTVMAALLLLAAVAQGWRVARWRIQLTRRIPLLWSLHLSYWFIPLGLLLLALHYLGLAVSFSTALHALTAGAVGGMILAMIARVSLGHSGRPLQPRPLMSLAFIALLLAALLRSLLIILWPAGVTFTLALSAALWCLAFLLFVVCYAALLMSPRPDGKPG